MNNENKELLNNDVEINISEEEIILAPPVELFDEAKAIAHTTVEDEKFPFLLHYNANQKEHLLSMLGTVGAIVEDDDDDGHVLATMMNMTQLAFIKQLDCVERVKTDEGINPFLAEEAVKLTAIRQEDEALDDEVQLAVTDIDPETLEIQTEIALTSTTDAELEAVSIGEAEQADGDIAVASVAATARSSCSSCPTNSDMAHAQNITVETLVSGCICCPGAEQWFKISVPLTKEYTIFTTGSLDTIGTLSGYCLSESITNDDCAGRVNFRIVETLCAGYEYYIKVNAKNNETGSYTLMVTAQSLAEEVLIHSNRTDGIVVLEQGKTYELPRGEGYGFLNVANTENAPLSVEVNPNSTTDKRVYWYASSIPSDPVDTGFDLYDNTTKYPTITANSCGGTKLYAYDWFELGKTGTVYVAVVPNGGSLVKATGISLDHTSLTLDVGEYQEIIASVSPSNATVHDVEWVSDNTNIATVTPYGQVKAIAPGTTKIRAKSMTGTPVVEAVCTVTVHDPLIDGTPIKVKCSGGLNVMSTSSNGSILGTFDDGSMIFLVDETPQNETMFYVYGIMTNGTPTYGWCSGEYLEEERQYLKSNYGGTINVRVEPTTEKPRLGHLSKGDSVLLLEENVNPEDDHYWNQILYAGIQAFAANDDEEDFTSVLQWEALIKVKDYNKFLNILAHEESSNNYKAISSSGSYLGKYQLGEDALIDSGFKDENGWTSLAKYYGVTSKETFRFSPEAQEVAIRLYHKHVWSSLEVYGATSVIGTTYQNITVSESGLLAAAHLIGANKLMNAIRSNESVADGNGTTASSYMSLMSNYDISPIK